MKFTVIIPTRERADTLYYSLKSCVTQDYDNLDILVSDNFSQDDTWEVVESFKDRRIRYINTGNRVSMTSNWEFALSEVKEGYVTYVGDDDGLMPNAIQDVRRILERFEAPSLIWRKAEYCWPSVSHAKNYMLVPLRTQLVRTDAKAVLSAMISWRAPYNRGPCLYNGFVATVYIDRIRQNTGRFFRSVTPDVYSSFALPSTLPWFLYSTRPFGVNGCSSYSNGMKSMATDNTEKKPEEIGDSFWQEIDMPLHPKMEILPNCLTSCLAEAMLQANDACYGGRLPISTRTHVRKMLREYSRKDPAIYKRGIALVTGLASRLQIQSYAKLWAKVYRNRPAPFPIQKNLLGQNGDLVLNSSSFDVHNVFEAAELAGSILGPYSVPDQLNHFRMLYRYTSYLHRKVAGYLDIS